MLTLIKVLIPGAAENLRAEAARILNRDTDYTQVISYISDKLSPPERTPQAQASPSPEESAALSGPAYSPVTMSSLREEKLPAVKRPASDELTQRVKNRLSGVESGNAPSETDGEGEGAEELPEAVQTFLNSQAAYSDYALPVNVTYSLSELPFPYEAPVSGYQSSGFGYRLHPILNEVKFHYGTDVAAYSGDTIMAFADGTVTFSGYSDSYGYYITIDHADGWQSLYAHCSQLYVQSGDSVTMGQQIALVGETGQATGPHLHFELTHNGVYVNPEYYVNYI